MLKNVIKKKEKIYEPKYIFHRSIDKHESIRIIYKYRHFNGMALSRY